MTSNLVYIAHLILVTALVSVPIMLWGYFFYNKDPQNKRLTALTFVGGVMSAVSVVLYQKLWAYIPEINALAVADYFEGSVFHVPNLLTIPMTVIVSFMIVGVIEELAKLAVVKIVDGGKFSAIDDAIEFSIIAALGFAFLENIIYLMDIIKSKDSFEFFTLTYLYRSLFSTFAHIFFSGILGYFYGKAHFAKPILQSYEIENRHKLLVFFHKVTSIKKVTLYRDEKLFEGIFLAVTLHALFNIFLHLNMIIALFPFLFVGFYILNYLIDSKENNIDYTRLETRAAILPLLEEK